jgi:beta-galactosidase
MRFVILVIAILLIVSTPLFAFDTKGLVLYYNFDEGSGKVAKDTSGNKNDGEVQGKVEWVAGKYGKALDFSDSDAKNQVFVKDNDSLDITDQITMSAWVNIKTLPDIYNAILCKNNTYMLHIDNQTNAKEARTDPLIWVGGAYGVWPSAAVASIKLGEWHHIAGVYDGKETRSYLDGVMVGSIKKSGNIDATTGDLVIGRDNRSGCETRKCGQTIDEVMIFGRSLSEDEVKQIMAGGKSAFAVDANGKLTSSWGYVKSNY